MKHPNLCIYTVILMSHLESKSYQIFFACLFSYSDPHRITFFFSASEFITISEHGVLFKEFGIAGGSTSLLHELGNEERNTACCSDHNSLPHKTKCQQKRGIYGINEDAKVLLTQIRQNSLGTTSNYSSPCIVMGVVWRCIGHTIVQWLENFLCPTIAPLMLGIHCMVGYLITSILCS